MEFKQRAQVIADEVVELLAKKQADYGPENILAFGEFGVLVRTADKVSRLRNLVTPTGDEKCAVAETVGDTWSDLVGYAIIALMLRRGTFTETEM